MLAGEIDRFDQVAERVVVVPLLGITLAVLAVGDRFDAAEAR
jgi:hypothetical protein